MKVFYAFVVVLILFCIGFGIYGIWTFGNTIKYNTSYRKMVEKTVVDMVKPEALKTK
jgi:hypothetical protein